MYGSSDILKKEYNSHTVDAESMATITDGL